MERHGLKNLEYLLRVDAFAARILEPPVAEVDVDTVSLLLLPHAQDLVPGACKLCGRCSYREMDVRRSYLRIRLNTHGPIT